MHSIGEVRLRAAESLLFKLKFGLVSAREAVHADGLLDCALQCVDLRSDDISANAVAVDILTRLAADEEAVRRMVALGGVPVLQGAVARPTDSEAAATFVEKAQLLLRQLLCVQPFLTSDAPPVVISRTPPTPGARGEASLTTPLAKTHTAPAAAILPSASEPVLPQGGVSFNWVHLLETDADRLVDAALILSTGRPTDALVAAALSWLGSVALRDYPPEVFLQRPQLMKVVADTRA